jgi:hypothetical protein
MAKRHPFSGATVNVWIAGRSILIFSVVIGAVFWWPSLTTEHKSVYKPIITSSIESNTAPTLTTPPKSISPLANSNPELIKFVTPSPVVGEEQATRITEDFTSLVPTLSNQAEINAVLLVLRDANDEDTARNEAANLLSRTHYTRLDLELMHLLERTNESPRMRFFFMQHLGNCLDHGMTDTQSVMAFIRKALDDRDLLVRREALQILTLRNDEIALKRLTAPLSDQSYDGIRDLAIHLLVEMGQNRSEEIRSCLSGYDEPTRIAAIATLGELRDKASEEALGVIVKTSVSPRERHAAQLAIERIFNQGF